MDITERRALEDNLRDLTRTREQRVEQEISAKEAALSRLAHAEKIQSIGELTGGVAHNFNNLLTGHYRNHRHPCQLRRGPSQVGVHRHPNRIGRRSLGQTDIESAGLCAKATVAALKHRRRGTDCSCE
jgi:hypothetical protein